ncbi:MAG: hypothetical protein HW403_1522, partial [Dehalococcoidia bacterium]|nr:hypothetical protein [Dehalococcoidia bacterium]
AGWRISELAKVTDGTEWVLILEMTQEE